MLITIQLRCLPAFVLSASLGLLLLAYVGVVASTAVCIMSDSLVRGRVLASVSEQAVCELYVILYGG